MATTDTTLLTERQREVLELRNRGHTQQEVAEEIGTTSSNVSAVERAAEENIEKAYRTVEYARTLSATKTFQIDAETHFGDVIERVYDEGDEADITIDYCRPELYSHLYGPLNNHTSGNKVRVDLEVGLTSDGEVFVFPDHEM